MISFVLSTYAFLEYVNYIKYQKKHNELNNYRNNHIFDEKEMNKRISILCEDIEGEHIDVETFVREMFQGDNSVSEISREEMYEAVVDNIYASITNGIDAQQVNRIINLLEKKLKIKFKPVANAVVNAHMSIAKDDIVAWYRPFIFNLGLKFSKLPSELYFTYAMNFKRITLKDDIVVWVRKGVNNIDNKGILFIPACIGGITFYPYFVSKIDKSQTIFIPEIPEMSWNRCAKIIPPNMSTISKEITKFVIGSGVKILNIMGHSFGTIVMNHIINEHYEKIKSANVKLNKIVYVEGLLYYVKVFSTINTIEDPIHKILSSEYSSDIATMSLFQRDLYVKFYIKRCLTLTYSLLSGETDCEKECGMHSIMCSRDNKFITKDYVRYIDSKKLNMKYTIFEDCTHGSFVWNNIIQKHVLDLLNS